MEYFLINDDGTCGGCVGTEPTHNNWTTTAYLGGFVKEFWNSTAWVEGATPTEIAEAPTDPIVTVNEVIVDLLVKQVDTMTEQEKTDLLQTILNP